MGDNVGQSFMTISGRIHCNYLEELVKPAFTLSTLSTEDILQKKIIDRQIKEYTTRANIRFTCTVTEDIVRIQQVRRYCSIIPLQEMKPTKWKNLRI